MITRIPVRWESGPDGQDCYGSVVTVNVSASSGQHSVMKSYYGWCSQKLPRAMHLSTYVYWTLT